MDNHELQLGRPGLGVWARTCAVLLAVALACSSYQLTALDAKAPGVVATMEQDVRLLAKLPPAAPELPQGIPGGLRALWLEVENGGAEPIEISVEQVELRIARHSLYATAPESIPLQVPQRQTMSLSYSPSGSREQATQGLQTPSARSSPGDVYTSTRSQVLATAFPSGSLAPGQQRAGFVYFALPDESFSRLELVVAATWSESSDSFELRAPLRYGPE